MSNDMSEPIQPVLTDEVRERLAIEIRVYANDFVSQAFGGYFDDEVIDVFVDNILDAASDIRFEFPEDAS